MFSASMKRCISLQVLLIDYYVDVDIEVHKIRYLARQFSDLPIQAIRACLSDLKPISGEWTTESAIAFTAMVKEKFLYAKIKAVDVKVIDLDNLSVGVK